MRSDLSIESLYGYDNGARHSKVKLKVPASTAAFLDKDYRYNALPNPELRSDVNEFLLFHGTSPD